jgi:hypothetical protein
MSYTLENSNLLYCIYRENDSVISTVRHTDTSMSHRYKRDDFDGTTYDVPRSKFFTLHGIVVMYFLFSYCYSVAVLDCGHMLYVYTDLR